MTDSETRVTKREFNSAFTMVWMFILLAMIAFARLDPGWSSGLLVAGSFLFLAAHAMGAVRRRRVPVVAEGVWTAEARHLLAGGDKIGAIKAVRNATDMGLREAKELVESWEP